MRFQHGVNRCCHRATRISGDRPCSTKINRPPGLRTRRISVNAPVGFGMEHKVQVITIVSKTASAKGTCSADPRRSDTGTTASAVRLLACQTASNRDPGSAWKRDPSRALGQACPGSEQEGPARVAQCLHERRSGARGRYLFAHRGKPGWHSGAVLEAPALVAGFDDFAVMGQAVEERGCHFGVTKHTGPIAKGQVGRDDDRGALV